MKKLGAIAFNALPLLLLAAWRFYGSTGAINLAAFLIWVVLLPAGFFAAGRADKRGEAVLGPFTGRWIVWPIRWATLGTLVWFGFLVTATAYLLHMLCIFGAAKLKEKELAEAQARAGSA